MNFRDLIGGENSSKQPAITGGRPGGLLSLRDDMNRVFGDFNDTLDGFPSVDVIEKENAFEITAGLPGMELENIDITVSEGGLTLTGERREETSHENKEKNFLQREITYGSFCRVIPLPDSADLDKADASFNNGMLTIAVPKRPGAAITKN